MRSYENDRFVFRYLVPICILVFLCFSFVRSPSIFMEPRFWAEEGSTYFQYIRKLSWISSLFYTANSNFIFLTNLLVSISSAAPSLLAPTVTTYGSILFASALPYAIARAAKDNGLDPITAIIASALVASVAMSFEIFGTATNIQWYSSAILFFVIFWHFPSEKVSPWIYVLAIIYGWTGIPSGILFPAFLVVGVVKQSRAHLIISAVLLIGVAIQVGCILNGPGVARHFEHRFSILVFPTVLHSILGLWITPSLASALGTKYLTLADGIAFLAISTLILSMPIKLASHARPLAMFALLVGFSASITQTFAGIGDADGFLKPVYGGRYYFISSSAIVLAFMFASKSHPKFVRIPLLLALTVNISAWYSQDWTVFTRGKPWEQVLDNCRQVTCTVPIWPEGWTVDIEK